MTTRHYYDNNRLFVYCLAKDKEHAVKIANEIRTEENSFYETCVFPAIKITNDCCEYEAEVMEVLETKRTGTPKLSKKIHLEMCEKYDKKVKE
jgi:hypothetical protein